jgi:hypothetical protein
MSVLTAPRSPADIERDRVRDEKARRVWLEEKADREAHREENEDG